VTGAEFAALLEGVKKTSSGWEACCPAHEDRRQSLSISEGDGGKVIVCCHAGCTAEAVVQAKGLTMKDLFPASSAASAAVRLLRAGTRSPFAPRKPVKKSTVKANTKANLEPLSPDDVWKKAKALRADQAVWRRVTKKMKLSEEVVAELRLGLHRAGGRRWLAYPYRRNGAWTFANCRSLDGEKDFLRVPAGQPTSLFNGDALQDGGAALLVEGEKDAAAALTMKLGSWFGYLCEGHVQRPVLPFARVVAIPGVAHVALAAEALAKQALIFIALDNDAPGDEAAEELARKLGPERCRRVRFAGVKDAGELLEQCNYQRIVGWTRPIGNGGAYETLHAIISVEPFAEVASMAPVPFTRTESPGPDAPGCPRIDDRGPALTSGTPVADGGEDEQLAEPMAAEVVEPATPADDAPEKEGLAAQLVRFAEEAELDFFHDPERKPYARAPTGEVWPITTAGRSAFRGWLQGAFWKASKVVARGAAVDDAIHVLEHKALHEGDEHPVFVRVARVDGRVYVDLGTDDCSVVEVGLEGWRVLDGGVAPVRFRRSRGMLPLPLPEPGGRLADLRQHLNLADDASWSLVAAWAVASYVLAPRGPFPLLDLEGEQGSAKTTTSERVVSILDPRKPAARALSRDVRELSIAANNSHLMAFDNVSKIDPWLSDALCRLATGAGFAAKMNYTDDEEAIFEAARPVLLNGIERAILRADLADRAVIVELPRIPDEKRVTKAEADDRFARALPLVFGGLLDAVSMALKNYNSISLPTKPRMADFAVVGVAAEPALGVQPGTFLAALRKALRDGNAAVADADPVAVAVRELVGTLSAPWQGTSKELLSRLKRPDGADERSWPRNAVALGSRLGRAAPALRAEGIYIEKSDDRDRRGWQIGPKVSPAAGKVSQQPKGVASKGNENGRFDTTTPVTPSPGPSLTLPGSIPAGGLRPEEIFSREELEAADRAFEGGEAA
jgi:hypothetical protein